MFKINHLKIELICFYFFELISLYFIEFYWYRTCTICTNRLIKLLSFKNLKIPIFSYKKIWIMNTYFFA